MKGTLCQRLPTVLVTACAVCLFTVGAALGAGTWADEIWNALTFYKASYPTSNFDPYFEKLNRVRDGIGRGDQQIVRVEMDQFVKMLQVRAHGISDVAADELYNLAIGVRPAEEQSTSLSTDVRELGAGRERLMGVPAHVPNTRDDGRTACVGFSDGGCDYWIDFMDDNTGG